MPIERRPAKPLASNHVPQHGVPYRVKDGDDWNSVARQFHVDAGTLIQFNFRTNDPDEVNWYLRQNVGCRKPTRDGKNWMFHSAASPGIIYIPRSAPDATTRIVHSVATMSWIDKRLYDPQDLPEVDQYTNPGATKQRADFLARRGYRFVNFLEASIVVNHRGEIIQHSFTEGSDLYFGPSFRDIMPKAYPVERASSRAADGKAVRFAQTVGCKTVSPETIGAREGVRIVDTLLGIHPNWGGPMGVQAENLGSRAGSKAAENFRVFPPIWTELALTISADGGFEGKLLRHSLFPSVTYYEQSYTVELHTVNVTKYEQRQNYDARRKIDEWRASGWGRVGTSAGPTSGNPWSVSDPRILGTDLPFSPDLPPDR